MCWLLMVIFTNVCNFASVEVFNNALLTYLLTYLLVNALKVLLYNTKRTLTKRLANFANCFQGRALFLGPVSTTDFSSSGTVSATIKVVIVKTILYVNLCRTVSVNSLIVVVNELLWEKFPCHLKVLKIRHSPDERISASATDRQ